MPDAPFWILFRPAGDHAPFNDPILKLVEADFLVLHAAGHTIRARTIKSPLQIRTPQPFQHVIGKAAVQPLDVHRVQGVFHDLQPVAGDDGRADIPQHIVPHEHIPAGQQWHWLWTQVREDQPA